MLCRHDFTKLSQQAQEARTTMPVVQMGKLRLKTVKSPPGSAPSHGYFFCSTHSFPPSHPADSCLPFRSWPQSTSLREDPGPPRASHAPVHTPTAPCPRTGPWRCLVQLRLENDWHDLCDNGSVSVCMVHRGGDHVSQFTPEPAGPTTAHST